MRPCTLFLVALLVVSASASGDDRGAAKALPGTKVLEISGDIGETMIAGVDRFLLRELDESIPLRAAFWKRETSSASAYETSVEPNRQRFAKILGLRDERLNVAELELVATRSQPALVGRGPSFEAFAVRWPVFEGVHGEGLWLEPTGQPVVACAVAIPDCEQSPEMIAGLVEGVPPESQFARRLAESGCRVIVPLLINRGSELSVIAGGRRKSTVTHREILYRSAYQMGRHLIGYEVQKVRAAVDWLASAGTTQKIGVVGYGEGGLVALYAAAVDRRVAVAGVSGYFSSRQALWQEPIDRNVFGLLREFGDAEIATLILPRPVVIEACAAPTVVVPPGGQGAPAEWRTPGISAVRAEVQRASGLSGLSPVNLALIESDAGQGPFGSESFLKRFLQGLGISGLATNGSRPTNLQPHFDPTSRMKRQYRELSEFSQTLVDDSPRVRAAFTEKLERSRGLEAFADSAKAYREHFRKEIIGEFDRELLPAAPRSRLAYDEPEYRGYEVVLDVFPDVYFYGILLIPKDISAGERRPVVVCQHGLEGRAQFAVEGDATSYRGFAARLAKRGFVTFAPQHLYRGGDKFRTLQRKANPLKKSLFSVMLAQHKQLLAWLGSLEFVDRERIGFYGISYGGKSAMRIPAILDGYALSICSSDFSNWIWRTVSNRFESGYLAHAEYEIFEFDLGSTFNYAEMAALICPRPFMVESLYRHGPVAEMDAAEYGRVRLLYENLGIPDRTEMTWWVDYLPTLPYTDRRTFDFLGKHLRWPK